MLSDTSLLKWNIADLNGVNSAKLPLNAQELPWNQIKHSHTCYQYSFALSVCEMGICLVSLNLYNQLNVLQLNTSSFLTALSFIHVGPHITCIIQATEFLFFPCADVNIDTRAYWQIALSLLYTRYIPYM